MTYKFDRSKHVFYSPEFEELIKDTIRFFNGTPIQPLPPLESFEGAGVYALYYIGKQGIYRPFHKIGGDQSLYLFNQLADEYPNLYTRQNSPESVAEGVPRRYGFHTNIHTKPMIIAGLQKYIREGAYIERDERCISEYLFYEKKPNGSFGAVAGKHDDLLMTRAIGLHVCFNEMELPTIARRRRPPRKKPNTAAEI